MNNEKQDFIKRYWPYFWSNLAMWALLMTALFHFVLPDFNYWNRVLLIAVGIGVLIFLEYIQSVSMLGYYSMIRNHFIRGLIAKYDLMEEEQPDYERARKPHSEMTWSYAMVLVVQCLLGAFFPVWWGALLCGFLLFVWGLVMLLVRGMNQHPEAQDYYEGFYGNFRNWIPSE